MTRKILLVVGHPDPEPGRFCRALAGAYAGGAASAGHAVRSIDLAVLDVPLLRSAAEFTSDEVPGSLREAVDAVRWADHLVFVFPLWLGTMPALLKAFLEQVMRPGIAFAYPKQGEGGLPKTLLGGRSARVVVTMGMPAMFYRLWFLGHGLAGMRRNILNFVGIRPVRETLYGMVEGVKPQKRQAWLDEMRRFGERAA